MWKNLCLAAMLATVTGLAGCVYHDRDDHRPYYRYHDEDRDGVANRNDADRDGDHVPNWRDRHPDDPRYY